MVNAMAASDRVIVPVQTEFLAQKGLERMIKTFTLMQRSRPGGFQYTIVPTMFDRRTRASLQTLDTIKEAYGDSVWNAVIPVDTKFRDASLQHIPLSLFAPESRGLVGRLTLRTSFENISLIPGSITLATLDRMLGNKEGMGLVLSRALQSLS